MMMTVISRVFFLGLMLVWPLLGHGDPIHDAVNNGDIATLQRLLKENPRVVNAQTPGGATALLFAAERGQAEAARILVEAGANVDTPQGDGWSPLHAAACDGNNAAHVAITLLLLDHKANPNPINVGGWTPLHAAAVKGNTATLQTLLDRGADVTIQDKQGDTPLFLAVRSGQQACIDLLLARYRVTVKVEGVKGEEAIRRLFAGTGLPFSIDTPITGTVTLDLARLPLSVALKTVVRAASDTRPLDVSLRVDGFHIVGPGGSQKPTSEPYGPLKPDLFQNPPNTFRPLPRLMLTMDRGVDLSQVEQLQASGSGGFVLTPWGGNEFLSDRWCAAAQPVLDEAKRRGMVVWLYDEDSYPSGCAGQRVVENNAGFEARGLYYGAVDVVGPRAIDADLLAKLAGKSPPPGYTHVVACPLDGRLVRLSGAIDLTSRTKGTRVVWNVPPGHWRVMGFFELPAYLETHATTNVGGPRRLTNILDPLAIRRFLDFSHERIASAFARHFGDTITACFTDEPAMNTAILGADQPYGGVPWWSGLPAAFKAETGYDLTASLPALFNEVGSATPKIRCDLFQTLTNLCERSYFGQIDDWCRAHKAGLTGHLLWEEHLSWHAVFEGSAIANLRRMSIPGMDMIGCKPGESMGYSPMPVPKLISSAAHVDGKARTMTECDYFIGANPSVAEQLAAAQWKFSLGINTIVLFGPLPAREFSDAVGRMGYAVTGPHHVADIAILYPIVGVWANTIFNGEHVGARSANPDAEAIDAAFGTVCESLVRAQHDYDIIEEETLAAAQIDGDRLKIGDESYRVVVLPPTSTIHRATLERLKMFQRQGGIVIGVSPLPTSSVEKGVDPVFTADIRALFTRQGSERLLESPAFVPALLDELIRPDLAIQPKSDGITYYHRIVGKQDIYLIANSGRAMKDVDVTLRAFGAVSLWDHHTGKITPLPSNAQSGGSTRVHLAFAHGEAHILVVEH